METQSSKENQSILYLDNHESHVRIQAIDLATENGVHLVTLVGTSYLTMNAALRQDCVWTYQEILLMSKIFMNVCAPKSSSFHLRGGRTCQHSFPKSCNASKYNLWLQMHWNSPLQPQLFPRFVSPYFRTVY